jgi:hypothetical protein
LVETNVTNSGGSFCNWPSQSALVPLNPPKPERDVVHAFLLRPPSRVKGAGKVYKPQRASGWSPSSTDPRYVKIYDTLNLITFRTLQRIREFVSIKSCLLTEGFNEKLTTKLTSAIVGSHPLEAEAERGPVPCTTARTRQR